MTRVWFAHGQTIYKQGAVGAALYIVGDGVVHMVQQAHSSPSTGQLERIATRKTALHGTCFGQEVRLSFCCVSRSHSKSCAGFIIY